MDFIQPIIDVYMANNRCWPINDCLRYNIKNKVVATLYNLDILYAKNVKKRWPSDKLIDLLTLAHQIQFIHVSDLS